VRDTSCPPAAFNGNDFKPEDKWICKLNAKYLQAPWDEAAWDPVNTTEDVLDQNTGQKKRKRAGNERKGE